MDIFMQTETNYTMLTNCMYAWVDFFWYLFVECRRNTVRITQIGIVL